MKLNRFVVGAMACCAPLFLQCKKKTPVETDNGPVRADLVFVNVNVVSMETETVLPNVTVAIKDRRIVRVAPSPEVKLLNRADTVNGEGKYLMPGLCDMHAHFVDENDFIPLIANGVTTIRHMAGSQRRLDIRARVNRGEVLGPQIFMAGPLTDGSPPVFNGSTVVTNDAEAQQAVSSYKQAGYDFVKAYSNLSSVGFNALMRAASNNGMKVIGHTPWSVGLNGALQARFHSTEHLYGYVDAVESVESDARDRWTPRRLYGAIQIDEARLPELANRLKVAGVWTSPTLVAMDRIVPADEGLALLQSLPGLRYVNPAVRESWDPEINDHTTMRFLRDSSPALRQLGQDNRRKIVKALSDAGAGLLLGTDCNWVYIEPGFSIHAELKNFVEAGLTPFQALRAGTYDAALSLDRLADFGTVSAGKRADLILLEANPLEDVSNVQRRTGVMLNGRWLTETQLQEMLEDLAERYDG